MTEKPGDTFNQLLAQLKDGTPEAKQQAIQQLKSIVGPSGDIPQEADTDAVSGILTEAALTGNSAAFRADVLQTIGDCRDAIPTDSTLWESIMNDCGKSSKERVAAVSAYTAATLGMVGDYWEPTLMHLVLEGDDPSVRMAAMQSLVDEGVTLDVPALVGVLRDSDPAVAKEAADTCACQLYGLDEMHCAVDVDGTVEALHKVAEDTRDSVRSMVVSLLRLLLESRTTGDITMQEFPQFEPITVSLLHQILDSLRDSKRRKDAALAEAEKESTSGSPLEALLGPSSPVKRDPRWHEKELCRHLEVLSRVLDYWGDAGCGGAEAAQIQTVLASILKENTDGELLEGVRLVMDRITNDMIAGL